MVESVFAASGAAGSWKFVAPATPQSLGILVPVATPDHLKIVVYNLDAVPVETRMTGWEIDPGKWEITQGTRGNAENRSARECHDQNGEL